MNCFSLVSQWRTGLAAAVLIAAIAGCSTNPAATRPAPPIAGWTLDSSASELRFVTTKNTNVAEVQQFKRLTGEVGANGAVKLAIDLASVETQIPLRNERLQTLLFEIARFPAAQFDAVIDMNLISALEPGASLDLDVAGKLNLHGQTQAANASLRVVKLRGDRLLVATRAPILVNAAQYELGAGIEKLREMMGLPNIVGTVPVSFALVFRK